MGELVSLEAVTLDFDGLLRVGLIYEDPEHRIGSESGTVGRAAPEGGNRTTHEVVGGEEESLPGQIGEVLGMVGIAGVVLVDGLVLRFALYLTGGGVYDLGVGGVGGPGDVG